MVKVKVLDNSINKGWLKGDEVEISAEQATRWASYIEMLEVLEEPKEARDEGVKVLEQEKNLKVKSKKVVR